MSPPRTSSLAIAAFIFAFVFGPVGLVLSRRAKRELATAGDSLGGHGLATAATIIASLTTAAWVLGALVGVWLLA